MDLDNYKLAVTKKTLANQDWKTQLARGYSNIPYNSIVVVLEQDFVNLYGKWSKVFWNENVYYVDDNDLDYSEFALEDAKKYYDEELKQYKDKFKI